MLRPISESANVFTVIERSEESSSIHQNEILRVAHDDIHHDPRRAFNICLSFPMTDRIIPIQSINSLPIPVLARPFPRQDTRRRLRDLSYLRHRPLQFPLHLLHAQDVFNDDYALPAAWRTPDLSRKSCASRGWLGLGCGEGSFDRRRALVAQRHRDALIAMLTALLQIDIALTTNGSALESQSPRL